MADLEPHHNLQLPRTLQHLPLKLQQHLPAVSFRLVPSLLLHPNLSRNQRQDRHPRLAQTLEASLAARAPPLQAPAFPLALQRTIPNNHSRSSRQQLRSSVHLHHPLLPLAHSNPSRRRSSHNSSSHPRLRNRTRSWASASRPSWSRSAQRGIPTTPLAAASSTTFTITLATHKTSR